MKASLPLLAASATEQPQVLIVVFAVLMVMGLLSAILLMLIVMHASLTTHIRKLRWQRERRIRDARSDLADKLLAGGLSAEPGHPAVVLWAKLRRWKRYQDTVMVLIILVTVSFVVSAALATRGTKQAPDLAMIFIGALVVVPFILLPPSLLLTQFRNPQLDCARLGRNVLTAMGSHNKAPDEQTTLAVLSAATRLGSALPKIALRLYLSLPNEQLQEAAVARFSRQSESLTEVLLAFDADALEDDSRKAITRLTLAVFNELAWTHREVISARPAEVRLARRLRKQERRLDRLVNVAPLLAALFFVALAVATEQLASYHGTSLNHPGSTLATLLKWIGAIFTGGKLLLLLWNWLKGKSRSVDLEATAHELTSEASDLAERSSGRSGPARD